MAAPPTLVAKLNFVHRFFALVWARTNGKLTNENNKNQKLWVCISFCWEKNGEFENQWWSVQIALVGTYVEWYCIFGFASKSICTSDLLGELTVQHTMHIAQWSACIQMHNLLVAKTPTSPRHFFFCISPFVEKLAKVFDTLTRRRNRNI